MGVLYLGLASQIKDLFESGRFQKGLADLEQNSCIMTE